MHDEIGLKLLTLFESDYASYLKPILDACSALNMKIDTFTNFRQGQFFTLSTFYRICTHFYLYENTDICNSPLYVFFFGIRLLFIERFWYKIWAVKKVFFLRYCIWDRLNLLILLMGVSAWIIWNKAIEEKIEAFSIDDLPIVSRYLLHQANTVES